MHRAWKRALDRLGTELPAEDVQTWLRPLQAKSRGGSLLLLAPNRFVADKVAKSYLARIRELVALLEPAVIEVRIELGTDELPTPGAPERAALVEMDEPHFDGKLDTRYQFDNFVEGKSNQLARATALQVALKPGLAYNPFLLYGGTGLGKTHLLHAAGNLIVQNNPRAKVLYLRSEEFIRAMMQALQQGKWDDFKRTYRSVDALLIDDIQFLAGKDRTQEEFFHLFNALYDAKQQIVMTCDRYPKEVDKLTQESWAYNPNLPKQVFDIALANKILDDAGWARSGSGVRAKNGTPLEFQLSTTTGAALREQCQQLLQQDWQQIGAKMTINNMPAAVIWGDFYTRSKFQSLMVGTAFRTVTDPDPAHRFGSDSIPAKTGNGANQMQWQNAEVDQLLKDGQTNFEQSKRKPIYWKLQEIAREELPILPIFQYAPIEGHKEGLIGYAPNVNARQNTWNMGSWYWAK